MIFVTVGTGDRGFDRLVRAIDAAAPEFEDRVCAQIGRGEYEPENLDWFRFTSEDRIQELYRTADVVVAHAGAGTLLSALSHGTPVVVLPRRQRHGEHNDDHQFELADALSDRPDVSVVTETSGLASAVEKVRSRSGGAPPEDRSLVRFLSGYIEQLES